MAIYLFEHPKTKEIKEVFLKMTDSICYVDKNGVKWDRIYTSPNLGFDTRLDPYSKRAFMDKTQKGGTLGELFDLSKEMSEKRGGVKNDPVKKQYSKEWKKKRNQDK